MGAVLNVTRRQLVALFIGLLLVLNANGLPIIDAPMNPEEFCERDTFSRSCPEGEVLLMTHALYGRMREGRCITKAYDTRQCSMDALTLLDARCSGRQSCDVVVANLVPENLQPCPTDFRSYLEVTYTCVQVATAPREYCERAGPIEKTQPNGYLSSLITAQTNCGSFDSPWWITVQPGQTIRVTLYDFKPDPPPSRNVGSSPTCQVYAVIREEMAGSVETVCGSVIRESIVYTSTTNQVEIKMVPRRQQAEEPDYFLLKYESIGCGIPPTPPYGWSQQINFRLNMGCKNDEKKVKWRLQCENGVWVGDYGNCTSGEAKTGSVTGFNPLTSSHGLSILIILAIAAIVGVFILLFGLFYLRKKRLGHTNRAPPVVSNAEYQDPYKAAEYQHQPGVSKSMDNLDSYQSTENDYYRTWQMQRHGQGQFQRAGVASPGSPGIRHPGGGGPAAGEHRMGVPSRPAPPLWLDPSASRTGAGSPGSSATYDRQSKSCYSDHIYESPNFERKEFVPVGYKPDGVPIEYFELDPDSPTGIGGK